MGLSLAPYIVSGHVLLVLLLGWFYFRRYVMVRPPIGVLTLGDVAFMMVGIIVVPYLYLFLPRWLLAGLLLTLAAGVLYVTLEPLLRVQWAIWISTLVLIAAEVTPAWRSTTQGAPFWSLHNVILVAMAVGIANLWAQSGMKARDAALLGVLLALYDFVFTVQLPLMADLVARVAGLPFAPLVAWPLGSEGQWLGIGLGDLLLATVFPLVMRKAFCRAAGWAALAIGFTAICAILLLPVLGLGVTLFPVMAALGPLMAIQYLYWRRRCGRERTTRLYLAAEPQAVR